MTHTQAVTELLQKAEALLVQGDARQAAILLDKVLRLDFTHPRAWELLHQMLGKDQPLDDFQRAFAQAHYPALAHLLDPLDLIPLSLVLSEPDGGSIAAPLHDSPSPEAEPSGRSDASPLQHGEGSTIPQPPQVRHPTPQGGAARLSGDIEGNICAYCGRYNPPGQVACLLCGVALVEPAPTNLICRVCGNVNQNPLRFCTQCGASLVKFDQPVPTPPQQVVIPVPPPAPVPIPPQPVILQVHEPPITPPAQVVISVPPSEFSPTSPSGGSQSTPAREGGSEGVSCPNCRRLNPPGARLCAFCGYDFFYSRVVTTDRKEKPALRFHFVDLGDLVVVVSLFLPWTTQSRGIFNPAILDIWGMIATSKGDAGIAAICYIILSLGASVLVRANHRVVAILAAVGALVAALVAASRLKEAGVYVALAGALLVLLGVIFFENETLSQFVKRHIKEVIIAIIAFIAFILLVVAMLSVPGMVENAQRVERQRATQTAAAKTKTVAVAQSTAASGTKAAADKTKSAFNLTQTATLMTGEPWSLRAVYVLKAGGKSDIYTSRVNGNDRRQLTSDGKSKSLPKWSPDGRYIVYQVNENNSSKIFIMNSDGSGQRQLVSADGADQPSWFPDSQAIVFRGIPGSGMRHTILRINIDGSGMQQLVQNESYILSFPAVSPDGKSLAYVRNYRSFASDQNLVVTDINGNNSRDLTKDNLGRATFPVWSQDGKRILFSTQNIQTNMYIINQDGSNMQNILSGGRYYTSLSWSKDNKYIAYEFTDNLLYTQIVTSDGKQTFRPLLNANDLSFGPP